MTESILSNMSDTELLAHAEPKTPLERELLVRLAFMIKKNEEILECVTRMQSSIKDDPLGFTKRQAY